jgi:ribosomal protein S18 acetylase RimI-like enzyme
MRYAPQPHWYLSQLGVEPAIQGQGYGRRILTPTLERIDREAKAVYLETLNPKAILFYENLGFKVREEVILPGGGPPMWAMLRDPQTG